MFPCTDELRLAEVRFRVGGVPYRAVLSSVGGHIFDLAIIPRPKEIAFAQWDSDAIEVNLLADPLRQPTGLRISEVLPPAWGAFLASGKPTGNWSLHDETTAYRVTLDDGEYLVLAERQGDEFLLHRVEPLAHQLFVYQLRDRTLRSVEGDPSEVIGEGA